MDGFRRLRGLDMTAPAAIIWARRCPPFGREEASRGLMLIDLHCHTRLGSEDSFLTPVELIQRAKALGLDGVCLTEHDWFWPPETLARLSEEHGILVVP